MPLPRLWRLLGRRRLLCLLVGLLVLFILVVFHHWRGARQPHPENAAKRSHQQEEYVDRRGIRVIVGHYQGDLSPSPNFTWAELNVNRYSPVAGAGEGGQPVRLKPHQEIQSKRLWHINQFNLMASDMIPVERNLSDMRSEACQRLAYEDARLPRTSLIIVFHNEAWSTLLRTVHSAINTSPAHLVQEIILVDDASEREFLKGPLEEAVARLPVPTTILRTGKRIGLIQARLMGAKAAKGEVLTFLDAHCECTPGWLQPLLDRIRESPQSVVCPVIDILNDDTFQYTKSFSLHWGGFNWELHFRWYTMGAQHIAKVRENSTRPYGTPVMAGGLFSIHRDYFWSAGSYDAAMDIWGGENLEMSFRVWQCGGRVEISPCSRVGHVFRKASPYTFPREGGVGAVLHSNLARVAMTWMDEYASFYFQMNRRARAAGDRQDVSQRAALRRQLGCRSFAWYLDTVWPEHFLPRPGRFFGRLESVAQPGQCVQKPGRRAGSHSSQPSGQAALQDCVEGLYVDQLVAESPAGYLMADESVCLDAPQWRDPDAGVRFMACAELDRQKWELRRGGDVVRLVHVESGQCLTARQAATSDPLTLAACSESQDQLWRLRPEQWTEEA